MADTDNMTAEAELIQRNKRQVSRYARRYKRDLEDSVQDMTAAQEVLLEPVDIHLICSMLGHLITDIGCAHAAQLVDELANAIRHGDLGRYSGSDITPYTEIGNR